MAKAPKTRQANAKVAKRRVVAKGVVAGKKTKVIAKEAAITPRSVQRIAAEPETQFLITSALRPHQKRLEKLATKVISAIDKGLSAMKTDKQDHFTRLRAVERYSDVLELAQGKVQELPPASEDGIPEFTWEQYVLIRRRLSASEGNPAKP